MHVAQLAKVIAGEYAAVADVGRQHIHAYAQFYVWFFYYEEVRFVDLAIPVAAKPGHMVELSLIYHIIFIQDAFVYMH